MKKTKIKLFSLLMLLCLVLAGCGAASLSDKAESAPNFIGGGMTNGDGYYDESIKDTVKPSEPTVDNVTNPSQKLIKIYNFRFETTDYDKSIGFVNSKINEYGGYIEKSETYGKTYKNSSMILRIPEDKINLFLNETGNIGEIIYSSESADDVTLEYYDIKAKIESLEIQYERILEILKKAEYLEDIIMLEQRLSEIQSQLNSYQTKINVYDNLVNYVTVNIDISEVDQIQVVEEDGFFDEIKKGLSSNFTDIINGISDITIWFITGIPYFIILGIVGFIVYKITKKIIKKYNNTTTKNDKKDDKENKDEDIFKNIKE